MSGDADGEKKPSGLAWLPDSADARLLAEVSSYSNDLTEADDALQAALGAGEGSPLWIPLTGFAVVAYMRAFGHSNVRPPLRAASVVPDEFAALHEKLRVYRNTTVAHSQSELVRPAPIAYLDEAGRIRRVGDAVISQHLPGQIARQFAGLIGLVQNTVEEWADDIRARLEERYAEAEPHVIASWPTPVFEAQLARDFSADSRRRPGSVFTHYLSVEPVEK